MGAPEERLRANGRATAPGPSGPSHRPCSRQLPDAASWGAPLVSVPVPINGPMLPDGGRLWSLTPNGRHYTTRTHFYWWAQVRAAAGLEGLEFHELKHFAASYMLNVLQIAPHHIAHQLAHA